MPISSESVEVETKWLRVTWSVESKAELAFLIARVALGQWRDVVTILRETGCELPEPRESALTGARALLEVRAGTEPFQRDGWLFQVISWIASHRENPTAIVRPPQMIWSEPGFDGLYVRINPEQQTIAWLVICEDKATTTPRQLIVSQVWPELRKMEEGARDNQLVAAVTLLLEGHAEGEQVIPAVFWEKTCQAYRIAVTAVDQGEASLTHENLFRGFDDIILGDPTRRQAEILYLPDVRAWLADLADQVLACLDELEAGDV